MAHKAHKLRLENVQDVFPEVCVLVPVCGGRSTAQQVHAEAWHAHVCVCERERARARACVCARARTHPCLCTNDSSLPSLQNATVQDLNHSQVDLEGNQKTSFVETRMV